MQAANSRPYRINLTTSTSQPPDLRQIAAGSEGQPHHRVEPHTDDDPSSAVTEWGSVAVSDLARYGELTMLIDKRADQSSEFFHGRKASFRKTRTRPLAR
jgi:hypothetical protein